MVIFYILVLSLLRSPDISRGQFSPHVYETIIANYAASKYRHNKILDVVPAEVVSSLTVYQCLALCLQENRKWARCRSFNYGNQTCFLIDTYLCEKGRKNNLAEKLGYSYYDVLQRHGEEMEYFNSKSCREFGKCSSHCPKYKVFSNLKKFAEAQATCEAEGGVLAMPRSHKHHQELLHLLTSHKKERYWIGLRRQNNITVYIDGSALDEDLQLWGEDQPNNSGGIQYCVEMLKEMGYKWNDFHCDNLASFICQYITT
ncbi:uncharacterized protein LOC106458842 isoform X1 [Limulus polyphemus]|uniref:Uncharacterized protein LOC106458842 isoform X1 n=1 Tax=Limulus polyphemus TaxID=6850 RepID=A0ABM1SB95_LIMPO|nr:uncharacterized protein LOC106458842 isoform X1 [Limulus polyphemus]